MQPHRYIIANWKMHGTAHRVREAVYALDNATRLLSGAVSIILALPFPYLHIAAVARSHGSRIQLAAQDVSAHAEGAYTGEVSATMLRDVGAEFVVVGHSERRQHHAETDTLVATKATAALGAGLTPIICVGETLEQYKAKQTIAVLGQQMQALQRCELSQCLLAYEPIWAIGSGLTPNRDEIAAATAFLHTPTQEGRDSAKAVVYGGSVNPSNAAEILATSNVSGALIGSASLNEASLITMVQIAAKG